MVRWCGNGLTPPEACASIARVQAVHGWNLLALLPTSQGRAFAIKGETVAREVPAVSFAARNFEAPGALRPVSAAASAGDDPDVQRMLAVQRGDREAFEQLFQRHIGAVVGFATQFVGSRARAEEIAQEVFLQVYRTRAHYVPRARFTTWLYRMASNACLSEVRRAEHHARAASPSPDSAQRAAILLARVEGLSYEEVAESLSCSVAAVKSLVHRATLALRDAVPEEQR